jgi:hypothetical protein
MNVLRSSTPTPFQKERERNGGGGGEGLSGRSPHDLFFPLCRDNNSQTFLILFKLNFSNQKRENMDAENCPATHGAKKKFKTEKKFRPVMYRSLSPSHPPL